MISVDELLSMDEEERYEYVFIHAKDNPEYLKILLQSPKWTFSYICNMLKHERWPEGEKTILKNPEYIIDYAYAVIKGRWPEGEEVLLKNGNVQWLCKYAKNIIGGRWREAEEYIKKDSYYAGMYAVNIIEDRWREAEETIINGDIFWASYYATNILNKRLPEIEDRLIENPNWAFRYWSHFFSEPWEKLEKGILKFDLGVLEKYVERLQKLGYKVKLLTTFNKKDVIDEDL